MFFRPLERARLALATGFALLFFLPVSFATHIVGGEITYRCLGNEQYEVTLTVYRDCYNGQPWFDNPSFIGVFDQNWDLVDTLIIDYTTNDTLPIVLSNPCLMVPPDVCVHRSSFVDTLTLPFRPGGYTLVYQRCCRNTLIRNIPVPLETGASYIAYLSEQTLLECNSSARFNNWPPVAICIHQPIDFDHGASDPDGDSLVYRLCTPLNGASYDFPIPQPPNPGPYQELLWEDPPYNLGNLLGGIPLTIDPNTGFMTGEPNTLGNFVVGVCVDEYRDGTVISTTRRDFQYNVSDCGEPTAAFFIPELICDTLAVRFENNSQNATFFRWYFNWDNNTGQTSVGYSPVFTYPDTGVYTVALIAQPNDPCSDTLFQQIHLTNSYAQIDAAYGFPSCDNDTLLVHGVDQSVSSVFPIESYDWSLSGPNGFLQQSNEQNPDFQVTAPGNYQLRLTITTSNGCQKTVILPVSPPFPPVAALADSLVICPGDTVPLYPGASPDYTYLWTPEASLSDPAAPNPLAFPEQNTLYQVQISGNGPCVVDGEIMVSLLNAQGIAVAADPDTIFLGDTTQLSAFLSGATVFQWAPTAFLSDPNSANPLAFPQETTIFSVEAPISATCTARAEVQVVVLAPSCEDPYLFFPTGFSPNGDGQNDALKLESQFATSVYWAVFNRWGEKVFEAHSVDDSWDGTYRGVEQPVETYGYFLQVRCLNGQEIFKKGNVTLLR